MTNALLFFNFYDFFGITDKKEIIDVVSTIRKNAKKTYNDICNPKGLFSPRNKILPWENDAFWQELNEIKEIMYDCLLKDHYITPDITFKFYNALRSALSYIHTHFFKTKDEVFVFEKLLTSKYANDLYNLLFWMDGARKFGIDVYLMSKEEFNKDYAENPKLMKELVEKIDIHVAFDLQQKYSPEFVSKIVQEGKVIIGQDQGNKAQFAFIPFMLNDYKRFCRNIPEKYLDAIIEFQNKYGDKMTQLIPPFVSFPVTTGFTETIVIEIINFFKQIGCTKVIVKGSHTAANRGSGMLDMGNGDKIYCPYMLLDVNATPESWLLELTNYLIRYGPAGSILLQAMVRDTQAKEIEKRFEEAVVHKTTIVGDIAWTQCVKTVYYFFKDFWKDPEVRLMGSPADLHYRAKDWSEEPTNKMGLITKKGFILREIETVLKSVKGVLHIKKYREHDFSDLKKEFSDVDQHLDMAGEFINLISPMGAHALDIVFGKIEEREERQLYLLEANRSNTRSDCIPVNYYTDRLGKNKNTMFDEYLEWALKICNGNPKQAGVYTKKLLFDLKEKERSDYLIGVDKLWKNAEQILAMYIIFCNNGRATLKKPAPVAV